MWSYWWIVLCGGGVIFGVGATMWLYAAAALAQVVSPREDWLRKEFRLNIWGVRLMKAGVVLALIAVGMAAVGLGRASNN